MCSTNFWQHRVAFFVNFTKCYLELSNRETLQLTHHEVSSNRQTKQQTEIIRNGGKFVSVQIEFDKLLNYCNKSGIANQ